jgi:hypothetical protein
LGEGSEGKGPKKPAKVVNISIQKAEFKEMITIW